MKIIVIYIYVFEFKCDLSYNNVCPVANRPQTKLKRRENLHESPSQVRKSIESPEQLLLKRDTSGF